MKILILGNFGLGWDGSVCDEEHIAGAFKDLGHQVTKMQRDQIRAFTQKYDFILISQWDGYPGNLITTLKTNTLGSPVVYWAFDYQADGQEWHERLVVGADLYLSKRIADSKYPNWQWLSQDFAPSFLDKWQEPISVGKYESPPISLKKDIDILFTGSYLAWATERNETLKAVDDNYNLVIHSVNPWPGFKNVLPPIMDQGLPELYARARIVISIDHTIEAGYWSDRNAQVMACGGFVFFRYIPLSKSIFKDHIAYFTSLEDCMDRLPQLLERPQEDLDAVADGGYRYAHNYMMVEDRVKDLITIVEGIL